MLSNSLQHFFKSFVFDMFPSFTAFCKICCFKIQFNISFNLILLYA